MSADRTGSRMRGAASDESKRHPVPTRCELGEVAMAAGQHVEFVGATGCLGPLPFRRLRRRVAGIMVNAVVIAGCDFYDYAAQIDENDARELLHAIATGQFKNADLVILEQVVGASPPSLKSKEVTLFQTKRIVMPDGISAQEFLRKHQSIGRHIRTAQKKLGIRVESISDEPTIRSLLPELAELHIERWNFDGVEGAFGEPLRIRQYESAAYRALLTRVMTGDEVLALHYGLVFDRVLMWHTPVINVAFLELSPLEILLGSVANSCEQQGIPEIDLGLGDESYKARFATDSRNVREFMIPLSLRGRAAAASRKRINADGVRACGQVALQWTRAARDIVRRRFNRVRVFKSAASVAHEKPVNGYREIGDWRDLVYLLRRSGLPIKRYQYDRIRNGQRYVCIEQDGQVVCYGWIWAKSDPFVIGETGEKFPARSVVLFDCVTPEPHRKKGHYTNLLRGAAETHRNETVYGFALTENKASANGILSAGYIEYRP